MNKIVGLLLLILLTNTLLAQKDSVAPEKTGKEMYYYKRTTEILQ